MKLNILVVLMLGLMQVVFAQQSNANRQQTGTAGTVIDLTAKTYNFSARMELPQVKIIERRTPPNFKQVAAEKSFINELKSGSEQIQFEPITSGKVKPVADIEKLLKKKRF